MEQNLFSKRAAAFVIDLLIISMLINIPYIFIFMFIQGADTHFWEILLSALMLTAMLSKDVVDGQSIGKRLMKIQVIDEKSGEKVSVAKSVIRNIFMPIWLIEAFVLLFSKEKRIGDYVAKTKVASKEQADKVNFDIKALVAITVCFCISLLVSYLVYKLFFSSPLIQLL